MTSLLDAWLASIAAPPRIALPGSFVQGAHYYSGATNVTAPTITLSGVTAGNLVVCCLFWPGTRTETFSDSQGNTWAQVSTAGNTGFVIPGLNYALDIWYCYATASGTLTATLTMSGSGNYMTMNIMEYSGYRGGLDTKNPGTSGSGSTITQVLTTTAANDLLIATAASALSISSYTAPVVLRYSSANGDAQGDNAGASNTAGAQSIVGHVNGGNPGMMSAAFKAG